MPMLQDDKERKDFQGLGIVQPLLDRITELGFVKPTPIQFKAIPIATGGEDVVGIAQTGSGKTLSFAIPMIQDVGASKKMGLVLLPTRELAVQVEEVFKKIAGPFGLRTSILIGGTNINPQIRELRNKPHIIVATPGRLIDHVEQKNISLANVGMLVLDEADRMLDMGFAPQLNRILSFMSKDRQTMLFSATMPEKIAAIAQQYMRSPLRIEVARPGTTAAKIEQEVFIVHKDDKMDLLERLLNEHDGSVLVFSRTKHGAKKIALKIRQMGHSADELHSNRSQNQRQKALKGFENGKFRVMVATDIAARGIDVEHLALVINFDLPSQTDDYTHRIGRTGRAGREGKAISFASPEEKGDIGHIQQLINIVLPIKSSSGEKMESVTTSTGRQVTTLSGAKRKGGGGGGGRGSSRQGGGNARRGPSNYRRSGRGR
ncbi:DEAD/DEAH box helicase [Candidatus Gracilibacteria bacterium]|nr:DEAD/DEAH box helicase [Candidatus Gracilibacteria bacterium]